MSDEERYKAVLDVRTVIRRIYDQCMGRIGDELSPAMHLVTYPGPDYELVMQAHTHLMNAMGQMQDALAHAEFAIHVASEQQRKEGE